MHEPVMSSSAPWRLEGANLWLSLSPADTGRCFSKIEPLLKIQAYGGEKHTPLFNTNLIALPVSSAIVLPVGGMTDRWVSTMLLG